jgi:hypothetical protein
MMSDLGTNAFLQESSKFETGILSSFLHWGDFSLAAPPDIGNPKFRSACKD